MKLRDRGSRSKAGFTLAEVMVALLLVGGFLVYIVAGLTTSKMAAAHTQALKQARELGLYTLGQLEAGLYWEDIDDTITGSYSELGYEYFTFEVAVGEDNFPSEQNDPDSPYNMWDRDEDDDEDEDDEELPYEKVRVRVEFPQFSEFTNELILERWIPWDQVYGEEEGSDTGERVGDDGGAEP